MQVLVARASPPPVRQSPAVKMALPQSAHQPNQSRPEDKIRPLQSQSRNNQPKRLPKTTHLALQALPIQPKATPAGLTRRVIPPPRADRRPRRPRHLLGTMQTRVLRPPTRPHSPTKVPTRREPRRPPSKRRELPCQMAAKQVLSPKRTLPVQSPSPSKPRRICSM